MGEVLGSIAVQVKHARSEARRALRQGRTGALRNLKAQQQNDEDINRLSVKAEATPGTPFTPVQSILMYQAGLTALDRNLFERSVRVAIGNPVLVGCPTTVAVRSGYARGRSSLHRRLVVPLPCQAVESGPLQERLLRGRSVGSIASPGLQCGLL